MCIQCSNNGNDRPLRTESCAVEVFQCFAGNCRHRFWISQDAATVRVIRAIEQFSEGNSGSPRSIMDTLVQRRKYLTADLLDFILRKRGVLEYVG